MSTMVDVFSRNVVDGGRPARRCRRWSTSSTNAAATAARNEARVVKLQASVSTIVVSVQWRARWCKGRPIHRIKDHLGSQGGRIIIHSHTRVGTGISLYRPCDGPLTSTDHWVSYCSCPSAPIPGVKRLHPRAPWDLYYPCLSLLSHLSQARPLAPCRPLLPSLRGYPCAIAH